MSGMFFLKRSVCDVDL